MKYYDPALDMNITETETRKGFMSCIKRIHARHYADKFPVLHTLVDKDADTIEAMAFQSWEDKVRWNEGKVSGIIICQRVGEWEGYGDGYGKGMVYSPA